MCMRNICTMSKFFKSIKVVSLFEQNCNRYLTACEDKKTVTLIRKHERSDSGALPNGAEWTVKWTKGPTGAFTGKCRLHSIYKTVLMVRCQGEGQQGYIRVYQDRWPSLDQGTEVEWNLSLKQVTFGEGLGIEAQLTIDYQQFRYFLADPMSMMCSYDRCASPQLEPYTSACKWWFHNWIVCQLVDAEQLLKHKKDQKKQNSTNNSNTPPPISNTTTTTTSTASKEVAVVKTPVSNNGVHHQLSQLTGWQVGQVILNYFTPGVGGGYSHYNSGHNINGSGTQTNGDVNVHTEVGNTRDVSVNFYSSRS